MCSSDLELYINEKIEVAKNLPVDIIVSVCELVWVAYREGKIGRASCRERV